MVVAIANANIIGRRLLKHRGEAATRARSSPVPVKRNKKIPRGPPMRGRDEENNLLAVHAVEKQRSLYSPFTSQGGNLMNIG